MSKILIDVFSDKRNNSVVQLPETRYLGSVIQGDALFLMHGEAMDILEELKHNPGSYAYFKTHSIASSLEQRLEHYIQVCEENNVDLNFRIEVSVLDYDEPL